MTATLNSLRLRRLGIDTHQEAVLYMRRDCHLCRSEGFSAQARARVTLGEKSIVATLNHVDGDLLAVGEGGLSEIAWRRLDATNGAEVSISHPRPLDSLSWVRGKVYGERFSSAQLAEIIADVVAGRFSDIELSSFVTACSARGLDRSEILGLTKAMIDVGESLEWGASPIVDKHCVGGLPGNRTTPIIVAIVAACGLTMPKTSSRAITSPAGTADAMETLAPVDLSLSEMRRVVEKEGGCIVWGGGADLSPADDTLIRIERALDLDSEGQLVASVLSKKAAAGATHLVLDLPVGPTAKVRSIADAESLEEHLIETADALRLNTRAVLSDGRQPVGRGIGPALEARDVLAVLHAGPTAPSDLEKRSVTLAGALLELAGAAQNGTGIELASSTLSSGRALAKFEAICAAQGGMREPPSARFQEPVAAKKSGQIARIDNRRLAKIAKLAGAPEAKAAGVEVHVSLGDPIEAGNPLFTIHAETEGELKYATGYLDSHSPVFDIQRQAI